VRGAFQKKKLKNAFPESDIYGWIKMVDQQIANQMSQVTHDLQNIVYIFGMAVGAMIELQAMIAANKERENKGLAMAYDEAAFTKLQEDYQLYHNSILGTLRG
jgi:hypothetical protein